MAPETEATSITSAELVAELGRIHAELQGLHSRLLLTETAADPDYGFGWGVVYGLLDQALGAVSATVGGAKVWTV